MKSDGRLRDVRALHFVTFFPRRRFVYEIYASYPVLAWPPSKCWLGASMRVEHPLQQEQGHFLSYSTTTQYVEALTPHARIEIA